MAASGPCPPLARGTAVPEHQFNTHDSLDNGVRPPLVSRSVDVDAIAISGNGGLPRDRRARLTSSTPTVAVLLPCRNEAATIGKVVSDFRSAIPDATVYVYDNASTDGTAAAAAAAGAVVRYSPVPGKGRVLRQMFVDIEAAIFVARPIPRRNTSRSTAPACSGGWPASSPTCTSWPASRRTPRRRPRWKAPRPGASATVDCWRSPTRRRNG